jgi:hypothetical protein
MRSAVFIEIELASASAAFAEKFIVEQEAGNRSNRLAHVIYQSLWLQDRDIFDYRQEDPAGVELDAKEQRIADSALSKVPGALADRLQEIEIEIIQAAVDVILGEERAPVDA